jgi:hypothetical protein
MPSSYIKKPFPRESKLEIGAAPSEVPAARSDRPELEQSFHPETPQNDFKNECARKVLDPDERRVDRNRKVFGRGFALFVGKRTNIDNGRQRFTTIFLKSFNAISAGAAWIIS